MSNSFFSGLHIQCSKKFYDWILEGTKLAVQKNKNYQMSYPYVMMPRSELPSLPKVNVNRCVPPPVSASENKERLDKEKSSKVQIKWHTQKRKEFKTTKLKFFKPKVENTQLEKEKVEAMEKNKELCIKALEYIPKSTLEEGELITDCKDGNVDESNQNLDFSAEAHEIEKQLTDRDEMKVKTAREKHLPLRYDRLFMNTIEEYEEHKSSKHHKSKKSKRRHKSRTGPKLEHLSVDEPYEHTLEDDKNPKQTDETSKSISTEEYMDSMKSENVTSSLLLHNPNMSSSMKKTTSQSSLEFPQISEKKKPVMSTIAKESSTTDFVQSCNNAHSQMSTCTENVCSPKLEVISDQLEKEVAHNIQQDTKNQQQNDTDDKQDADTEDISKHKNINIVNSEERQDVKERNYTHAKKIKSTEESVRKSKHDSQNDQKEVHEENTRKLSCAITQNMKWSEKCPDRREHNVLHIGQQPQNVDDYQKIKKGHKNQNQDISDMTQLHVTYCTNDDNTQMCQDNSTNGIVHDDKQQRAGNEDVSDKISNNMELHPAYCADDDTTQMSQDHPTNVLLHKDKQDIEGHKEVTLELPNSITMHPTYSADDQTTHKWQVNAKNVLVHNDKGEIQGDTDVTHQVSNTMHLHPANIANDQTKYKCTNNSTNALLHEHKQEITGNKEVNHGIRNNTQLHLADGDDDQRTDISQTPIKALVDDDKHETQATKQLIANTMQLHPADGEENQTTKNCKHNAGNGLVHEDKPTTDGNRYLTHEVSQTLKVHPEHSEGGQMTEISIINGNNPLFNEDTQKRDGNKQLNDDVPNTMKVDSGHDIEDKFPESLGSNSKIQLIHDDKHNTRGNKHPHDEVGELWANQPSARVPDYKTYQKKNIENCKDIESKNDMWTTNLDDGDKSLSTGVTYYENNSTNANRNNLKGEDSAIANSQKNLRKHDHNSAQETNKKLWNPFTSFTSPKPPSPVPRLPTTIGIATYSSPYANYYDCNVQPSYPSYGNTTISSERSSYHNPLLTHPHYNPMYTPHVSVQHPFHSEVNQYGKLRLYPNVTGNWQQGPHLPSYNSTSYYSPPLNQGINTSTNLHLLQRQMETINSSTPSILSIGKYQLQERNYWNSELNKISTNTTLQSSNSILIQSHLSSNIEQMRSNVAQKTLISYGDVQEIPNKLDISSPLQIAANKHKWEQSTKPTEVPEIQATAECSNYWQRPTALKMHCQRNHYQKSREKASDKTIRNEKRSTDVTQAHFGQEHKRKEIISRAKTQCIEKMPRETHTNITAYSKSVKLSSKVEVNTDNEEQLESTNIEIASPVDSQLQLIDENDISIESNAISSLPPSKSQLQEKLQKDDRSTDIPIEYPSNSNSKKLELGSELEQITDSGLTVCNLSANYHLQMDCANTGSIQRTVLAKTCLSKSQLEAESGKEEMMKPNADAQIQQLDTKKKMRYCTTTWRGLHLLRKKFKVRNAQKKKSQKPKFSVDNEETTEKISTSDMKMSSKFDIKSDNQIQTKESDTEISKTPTFTPSEEKERESKIWFNEEDINIFLKDSEFKEYNKYKSKNLQNEDAILHGMTN